jgi:hypothetical protein
MSIQQQLKKAYKADFTDESAKLIKAARSISQGRPRSSQEVAITTADFLETLINGLPLLDELKLYPQSEDLPDFEDEYCEESFPLGSTSLSVELHSIFQTAADLANSANNQVSSLHLLTTLIGSGAKGVEFYLQQCGSSTNEVAGALKERIPQTHPEFTKLVNLPELLGFRSKPTVKKTNKKAKKKPKPSSDTGENTQFIDKEEAKRIIEGLWSNFEKRYSFESDLKLVFEHLRKAQIKHAYSIDPNNSRIVRANVPWQLSKKVLLYGMLSYALDLQDKDNKENRGKLQLSKRILTKLGSGRPSINSLVNMAFDSVYQDEQDDNQSNEFSIAPSSLNHFLSNTTNLCMELSGTAKIGERHILATWFLDADAREQLRLYPKFPQISFSCLQAHIEQDARIDQVEKDRWKETLAKIDDSLRSQADSVATEGITIETTADTWTSGNTYGLGRDSKEEEIGGSTKDYVEAIADAFEKSDEKDFCFALFGPWGSGKTTLMELVTKRLNNSYTTVCFNAWKYPTRPEVWVSLYETICESAGKLPKAREQGDVPRITKIKNALSSAPRWEKLKVALLMPWWNRSKLALQTNLKKDDGVPFLLAGLLLIVAAIPKGEVIGLAFTVNIISALISAAILGVYFLKLWKGAGQTLKNYLFLPSHKQHLGLQSVIGDDLKNLLKTWTEEPITNRLQRVKHHWIFLLGGLAVSGSLGIILHRYWDKSSNWLIGLLIVLIITVPLALYKLLAPIHRPEKVLLVVDDLDRCPPDEMLAVIESLRVLLDDPEVSKCLKIAMLIDARILGHAIARKFEHLADLKETNFKVKEAIKELCPKQLITEQIEKLFLLSFQIPPLNKEEIQDIAEKLVALGEENRQPNQDVDSIPKGDKQRSNDNVKDTENAKNDKEDLNKNQDSSNGDHAKRDDKPEKAEDPSDDEDLNNKKPDEEPYILSRTEKEVLIQAFHKLHKAKPNELTPRRMRMLQMRFYLARDLCNRLDCKVHPGEIVKLIEADDLENVENPRLKHIIRMVRSTPATLPASSDSTAVRPVLDS